MRAIDRLIGFPLRLGRRGCSALAAVVAAAVVITGPACRAGGWDPAATVRQSPHLFVGIERHSGGDAAHRPRHVHPVTLDATALATVLSRLSFNSKGLRDRDTAHPMFAPSLVGEFAQALVQALAQAAPEDRVRFEVRSRDPDGALLARAHQTTGVIYCVSPGRLELRLEMVDETEAPNDVQRYSGPSQRTLELIAPATVTPVTKTGEDASLTTPFVLAIDASHLRPALASSASSASATATGVPAAGGPVVASTPSSPPLAPRLEAASTSTPTTPLPTDVARSAGVVSRLALLDELARAGVLDPTTFERQRQAQLSRPPSPASLPADVVVSQRYAFPLAGRLASEASVVVFTVPTDSRPRVAVLDDADSAIATFDLFTSANVQGLSAAFSDLNGDGLIDLVMEYRHPVDAQHCPTSQRQALVALLRAADGYLVAQLDDVFEPGSLRRLAVLWPDSAQLQADIRRIDEHNARVDAQCTSSR